MQVEITMEDVQGAGHGNTDDPLVRALHRLDNRAWWTEIYSQGRKLSTGQAWARDGVHRVFSIDPATTAALQKFDAGVPFNPCTATLTEAE